MKNAQLQGIWLGRWGFLEWSSGRHRDLCAQKLKISVDASSLATPGTLRKIDRRSNVSRLSRRIRRTPAWKVFFVFESKREWNKASPRNSLNRISHWEGDCSDSGAQKTVIGLPQAKSYCKFLGIKFQTKKNNKAYQFGIDRQKSLGSIQIRIPTPHNSFLPIRVDVVPTNIPFLLDLDLLDQGKMYFDNVKNIFYWPNENWELSIVRKLGHAYLEWSKSDSILYTKTELLRLHRGFQHPSDDKLLNLMKLVGPE